MFRTEIVPQPSEWKINLTHQIFLMGSCFSIHIGKRLDEHKFKALTNPFGTLYNPISLFQLIKFSLSGERPGNDSYLHHQGVFRNFYFHSDISSTHEDEFHQQVSETFQQVGAFLLEADVLLLTFGSAIVYRRKENGEIVANCHKVPDRFFEKSMLGVQEVVDGFQEMYNQLKKVNPNAKVILTVSPVRHLKDTLERNSVSKATLRVACEDLRNRFSDVSYFPSYELMIDDLRDYRFYAEDMLHPTEQTIKYIWNKFSQCYFDDKTLSFLKEWEKILRSLHHRPFYPGSNEHVTFLKRTLERIEAFGKEVDVSREREMIKEALHKI